MTVLKYFDCLFDCTSKLELSHATSQIFLFMRRLHFSKQKFIWAANKTIPTHTLLIYDVRYTLDGCGVHLRC